VEQSLVAVRGTVFVLQEETEKCLLLNFLGCVRSSFGESTLEARWNVVI